MARRESLARALLRLARPSDWAKSVFVLLPLPFALRAGASLSIGALAFGVAAFCLTASAVYVMNDLRDCERDREHRQPEHQQAAECDDQVEEPLGHRGVNPPGA